MTELIPDIRGPKLSRFLQDTRDFEFVRLLSAEDEPSLSEAAHSRVFEIKSGNKRFALKVFNFFSLEEIRPFVPYKEHLLKDNVVRYQLDPFFAECRAFGRLIEKGKDDLLAVRCYGYMFLSGDVERRIEQQFGISDWNRAADDEGRPLRAIAKDYIRFNSFFGRKSFPIMRQKLEQLNKMGIYNMDIREDNYRGGRLFDFSIAITSPHIGLWTGLRSIEEINEDMDYDLACFDLIEKTAQQEQRAVRDAWSERLRLRR